MGLESDVEWLMSARNKIRLQLEDREDEEADPIEVALLTLSLMLIMIQNTMESDTK